MLHTILQTLKTIFTTDHYREVREAYLAQAVDIYDLEYRQRVLQKAGIL